MLPASRRRVAQSLQPGYDAGLLVLQVHTGASVFNTVAPVAALGSVFSCRRWHGVAVRTTRVLTVSAWVYSHCVGFLLSGLKQQKTEMNWFRVFSIIRSGHTIHSKHDNSSSRIRPAGVALCQPPHQQDRTQCLKEEREMWTFFSPTFCSLYFMLTTFQTTKQPMVMASPDLNTLLDK